jgi:hypothetical protein
MIFIEIILNLFIFILNFIYLWLIINSSSYHFEIIIRYKKKYDNHFFFKYIKKIIITCILFKKFI